MGGEYQYGIFEISEIGTLVWGLWVQVVICICCRFRPGGHGRVQENLVVVDILFDLELGWIDLLSLVPLSSQEKIGNLLPPFSFLLLEESSAPHCPQT